jgi:flagellin
MRIGSSLFGTDLTALHNLTRAHSLLQLSSTRLATMRRINRGADDPAGLIAVEQLQSELTSIRKANDSAARAAGMIHVADSGMSQVTGLLNSVRANVMDVAGGNLSDAEIKAKQIEIDAAMEAVNRIGNYTTFGRRKLLDGSAGPSVSGVNASQVTNIDVHYNAGGGERTPNVEVVAAATSAALTHTSATGALAEDTDLAITGGEGTVTLEFSAGASLADVAQAVNATTDSSGVAATVDGNELTFTSVAVGSEASVAVEAVTGTFDTGAGQAEGTDVVVRVDGVEFTGQGNAVEIHTETLQADLEFVSGFSGQVDPITISGGAMTFNFSPDLGRPSMLALPNVNATALGGSAGRLSDLTTGGSASLASGNLAGAIDILDTARDQVLEARARAGAFEKYTIQSSQSVLDSMEENLSSAMSSIFDTDVAAETSRLIRSQILVDAATSTMMIVGRQRGLVATLLGGF